MAQPFRFYAELCIFYASNKGEKIFLFFCWHFHVIRVTNRKVSRHVYMHTYYIYLYLYTYVYILVKWSYSSRALSVAGGRRRASCKWRVQSEVENWFYGNNGNSSAKRDTKKKKRMENPLRRTLIYFLHIKRKIVLSQFSMSFSFLGFSLLRVLQLSAARKLIISEEN